MDEGWGCIAAIGAAAVAVALVLLALAWTFITMVQIFGHGSVVVMILAAAGGLVGFYRHQARSGPGNAVSEFDMATIGSLQLLPNQWAQLVLWFFLAIVALYGIAFV
jgi:hypothetical protein